jgi:hypothetical protein
VRSEMRTQSTRESRTSGSRSNRRFSDREFLQFSRLGGSTHNECSPGVKVCDLIAYTRTTQTEDPKVTITAPYRRRSVCCGEIYLMHKRRHHTQFFNSSRAFFFIKVHQRGACHYEVEIIVCAARLCLRFYQMCSSTP